MAKLRSSSRSPITPVLFVTAQARDRDAEFTRDDLEKFGKEVSADRNRKFVDVAVGKRGKIVVASIKKTDELTPLQKVSVVGKVISLSKRKERSSMKFIDITTPKKLKIEARKARGLPVTIKQGKFKGQKGILVRKLAGTKGIGVSGLKGQGSMINFFKRKNIKILK